MFDGKVINALTNTNYSAKCNICGAGPKEINNLSIFRGLPCDEQALKLGLSSLHAWIRSFEYILHLGYKLDIQSFYARTPEQKSSVAERKRTI